MTAKVLVVFIKGFANPTGAEQSRAARGSQRIIWTSGAPWREISPRNKKAAGEFSAAW
jgi:hypothetical protein